MKNINKNMDVLKKNHEMSVKETGDNPNGSVMGSLSSEEQEEFDDEIEPRLKYERMGNNLTSILSRDAASCLAVHPKFLAIGTQWGSVFITDHIGNVIDMGDIICHSTTVNQISIDSCGEYLASCSDDGKVIINGLYSSEDNQIMTFDRPVKSVAIDPNYGKTKSNKQFVTGDTKVALHERKLLGRIQTTLLHPTNGAVGIKWQSNFIAWPSSQGVYIYDLVLKRRISLIKYMDSKGDESEDVRCTIFWKDDRSFVIARLNTIQVCIIKDVMTSGNGGQGTRIAEIVARENFDFVIAGFCFYNEAYIILSYSDSRQKDGDSSPGRPHLRIINSSDGDEITNDALSIRGFQSYKCKDYHLESCLEEGMFFIVSPKDIVVARQRDEDDHLDWLIEHEEFQEALEFATKNAKLLKKRTCQDVGFQWFTTLFDEKRYREAASLCPQLFGRNKEYWESYIIRFKQFNQLDALAHLIPTECPRLDISTYEMILHDFICNKNEALFLELIKKWSPDLYNRERLLGAIMDQLEQDRNNIHLLESLGHLYSQSGKYEKAFYIYVKLGHKDIFDFVYKHDLFDDVSNHVVTLMEFNSESTIDLLINNVDKITPNKVISQLKRHPKFLLSYLSQLIKKDQQASAEHHQMLVELYADHDQPKLLSFLQTSSFISLKQTLELCKRRNFVREAIYLLDRMGNSREALRMMLRYSKDSNNHDGRGNNSNCNVNSVIEFCKNHSDPDLWKDLIEHSMDKPDFVIGLLNNIGGHVDPILLIRQINEKMEIPGLRDALIRIINDYHQQVYFQERCSKLANDDFIRTSNDFVILKKSALFIGENAKCGQCLKSIRRKWNAEENDNELLLFKCQHIFHAACTYSSLKGRITCPSCLLQNSNEFIKTQRSS